MTYSLSMSSLSRGLSCGWELHPTAEHAEPEPSDDADFGSAVHEVCLGADGLANLTAICAKYGQTEAEVLAYARPVLKKLSELPSPAFEVALAWNPTTGRSRMLGQYLNRAYGLLEPSEIPGTADLWYMDGETLVVADLKTGHANYVPKPAENAQLLALASALAAAGHFGPVRLELWFARPGGVWVVEDTVGSIELVLFADKLVKHLAAAKAGHVSPRPGDHCKYCPARRGNCPAALAVAQGIVGVDKFSFSESILSQAHAEWLVDRLSLAKKLCEGVEKALKQYADEHDGIVCSDGKVWKAVTAKRTSLNKDAVAARLGDEYEAFTVTHEYKTYRKVKP